MNDEGLTPPHNDPAEAALISACLTSAKALAHAAGTVTPDDFYNPANRRVYAALLRLHTQGQPIDPVTVADEVQTGDGKPGIDPVNVISYLASLGVTAHSERYATIVARMARLRRILHLCGELETAVWAFDDTAIGQALDGLAKEADA